MGNELKDKLTAFWQWYEQLYGKEMFVSSGALPDGGGGNALSPLERFRKEIEDCQKCPLHKNRTNFVFGEGNEQAHLMFIGEAPGREEDLQGRPFVGASGQLLNKMLAHLKMKREDVYIANILKSRPPNNRDPRPEEVAACIPYLHRQIELIEPKILVALGRVAAQNLLQTGESLGKLRRRVHRYRDILLIVTYHPAYILRNMRALDDAVEDLRFAITEYRKTSEE